MVFPTPPQAFRCRECGWHKTVPHQIGDARLPGYDHFSECPQCGKDAVSSQPASTLEMAAARLGQIFGKR